MEFDAKKNFPTKEGFGYVAISVPAMQAEIDSLLAEMEVSKSER